MIGERLNNAINEQIKMPAGYSMVWSGQYEYMVRAQQRLAIVVPMTLLIIFLLLYFNFKSVSESLIVMLSVPFSLTGGFWLMYLLGYNMSVAVGVGFIALAGVAAETGVVMLIYLDISYKKFKSKYRLSGATAMPSRPKQLLVKYVYIALWERNHVVEPLVVAFIVVVVEIGVHSTP